MPDEWLRCLLLSDFNTANLAGYLENDEQPPEIYAVQGDYGQVLSLLGNLSAGPWSKQPDFAFIWTRPERVIPSFAQLLEYEPINEETLLAEVDWFASLVLGASQKVKGLLCATWAPDPFRRGMGMADLRGDRGIRRALLAMNLRLVQNLERQPNVFALDTQSWLLHAGRNAPAAKLWYQAKIPYGNEVFLAAVADIKAAIRGLRGGARKLIVLDLDNTLWGGVVGDDGWENLRLGGHDPAGEAFREFQQELKALTRRGVMLGLASKNSEAVALEAMRSHPEMCLHESDFVGWRIDWNDKAQNIADLVEELNLGLQSVVFLDDNPLERARVREALPEVLVPEWPNDPLNYVSALRALDCFDAPTVSREDGERTRAYVTERHRIELKRQAGSVDDWLKTLGIIITVERLGPANLKRAAQLLNKTNQLNLSTRRLTESELDAWVAGKDRGFWTFHVADKFGDAGLTGLASIEKQDEIAHVRDFVLSCRVMGRKVEQSILAWLVARARDIGASELRVTFLPTKKNGPMLEFLRWSGLDRRSDMIFEINLTRAYPQPNFVDIKH